MLEMSPEEVAARLIQIRFASSRQSENGLMKSRKKARDKTAELRAKLDFELEYGVIGTIRN